MSKTEIKDPVEIQEPEAPEADADSPDVSVAELPERDERVFTANYSATGRRKTAVARVFLTPGPGRITINKRPAEEYVPAASFARPFEVTGLQGKFDVKANVHGGGFTGQADAICHGISRALGLIDENARKQLKAAGLLTRDSRKKERKKYGQRGARARFQFSKR